MKLPVLALLPALAAAWRPHLLGARRAAGLGRLASSASEVPMEDRDVPEGHKGLHDALYADGATEAHAAEAPLRPDIAALNGETLYEVDEFLEDFGDDKFPGVYAVHDIMDRVVFIGISRHVALAVRSHLNTLGDDDVSGVAVKCVKTSRRAELDEVRLSWIAELDYTPEGNGDSESAARWTESAQEQSGAMSDAERSEYEANKYKMQMAMAQDADADAAAVPGAMRDAVEKDDWSAVVDGQQQQAAAGAAQVSSPFAAGAAGAGAGAGAAAPRELTRENVETVLDEVRPFLVADGGNVAIVDVDAEEKVISLALQGACGSCPSATVTMQMGIERRLREVWTDLKEVRPVDDPMELAAAGLMDEAEAREAAEAAGDGLSAAKVKKALEPIAPAIQGMGGSVEVVEVDVDAGAVTLRYDGPPRIAYGIELSLKDIPEVETVTFL